MRDADADRLHLRHVGPGVWLRLRCAECAQPWSRCECDIREADRMGNDLVEVMRAVLRRGALA